MSRNPADVVLSPRGRRVARFGKRRIVALVSQGAQELFGAYTHPTVEIRCIDEDGETSIYPGDFCVRFQQHRKSADALYFRPGCRGFLTTRRDDWSAAYAGTIECSMRDRRWVRRCLDLLGKADGMTHGERRLKKGGDCEMLRLVVGLQRSGVEVRVYSEHLRTVRAKRERMQNRQAA